MVVYLIYLSHGKDRQIINHTLDKQQAIMIVYTNSSSTKLSIRYLYILNLAQQYSGQ